MKRIVGFFDKKRFGNKIHIFKAEDFYLCIVWDRGDIGYSVIDKDLQYLYPIDSLVKRSDFRYDFNDPPDEIDTFIDFDLSVLGRTECDDLYIRLIENSLHITT